jgi:hypothetical protein
MKPSRPLGVTIFLMGVTALLLPPSLSAQNQTSENIYYALIRDAEFGNGKYIGNTVPPWIQERVIATGDSHKRHLVHAAWMWRTFWEPFNELYKNGYRLIQIYKDHDPNYSVRQGEFSYEGPAEITTYFFEKR